MVPSVFAILTIGCSTKCVFLFCGWGVDFGQKWKVRNGTVVFETIVYQVMTFSSDVSRGQFSGHVVQCQW